MLIVISRYLCSISTAFSLIALYNLTSMNNTHTQRDVGLGVLLLTVMFQRLLEAESSVADEDVVDLFEVEIDVVVMMRILASVPFALLLFFSTSSCGLSVLHITLARLILICC